jgi:hypothetical protein
MNTTRRNYLKTTAAVVGGIGTVGAVAVTPDTFDVAVFATDGVRGANGDPRDAARRAKAWIEGAFTHPENPYEVSVTVGTAVPPTPDESVFGERSGTAPCGDDRTWNHLLEWWKDYHTAECTDTVTAADSHLLLSAGDGGGLGYVTGRYAVVGSGMAALRAGDYQRFGYGHRHKRLKNVLHELGHNLIRETPPNKDGDDTDGHHDMATVKRDGDGWFDLFPRYGVTPMGISGDQNNCGCNDHPKAATDDPWWLGDRDDRPDGFALFYSECTVDHLRPLGD